VGVAVRVGAIDVVPLNDGTATMPREFWVGFDFERHPGVLAPDGRIHMPIGCYLVRTGDQLVLLDAGLGPMKNEWGRGGDLPAQLAAAGVAPGDIDLVVCTHLHLDHAGWLVHDGAPFFGKATVRFGADDWARFVVDAEPDDHIRLAMELLRDENRLDPIDGDMVPLAPGLTARFTPGHTEGHYSLVVASGDERLFLLGDAVECPLQIAADDFNAMSDVDPDLARRTREAVWREVEGTADKVGGAHFPGLEFGRVLRGVGKRWFGS
jgi:glyoxylase-like metal-dependent hydrolase (beta-lactamase superfamily II)